MAAAVNDTPRNDGGEDTKVCLGVIVGAHGVRGVVRIRPFTESPGDVGAYGPVTDESGTRSFTLAVHGEHKGAVLAGIAGIADRDAALALKGLHIYVDRAALPDVGEEDAFYHADLIGLSVEDTGGAPLGQVVDVQDFGAGDLLEVAGLDGKGWYLPFTRTDVPTVDLKARRIVADPPSLDDAGDGGDDWGA